MNWITGEIAIGSVHEASDPELLRRNGIRSILGLVDALAKTSPMDLGVSAIEVVPLIDGEGNDFMQFCWAVTKLSRLVDQSGPVLVHCQAGWSRSPAVVAAYLVRHRRLTAEQALAEIRSKRVCSMVREMQQLVDRFWRECD
ncbi:dual specificity protein phosphatase family protein [Tundrisphaera sp. TA3]|uniref:dual specificity protein phosphatase family protein n=1 Tax=Tundrisphaera sp. TA3 TaxID=3435775 RepID=UPI003EBADC93